MLQGVTGQIVNSTIISSCFILNLYKNLKENL
jgi:hypothetical protein